VAEFDGLSEGASQLKRLGALPYMLGKKGAEPKLEHLTRGIPEPETCADLTLGLRVKVPSVSLLFSLLANRKTLGEGALAWLAEIDKSHELSERRVLRIVQRCNSVASI
jgi:hypothetical protein